ncbi:MAG TPA: DMT family transporter [Phenylobacterium sp.]|nr:DMT family transporter [Phenylobacterium sp.]
MSDPAPHPPSQPGLGIAFRVIATGCFATLAAIVKWAGDQGVPVLETIFFRNAFAFVPVLIYMGRTTGFGVLKTSRPLSHLARSGSGLVGMTCGFTALTLLPLTDATALAFASPLFMTALSVVLLGERVGPHRWGAVAVGFVGVLIMVRPTGEGVSLTGVAFALTGALGAAFAMIAIRRISRTEPGPAIVFYFTLAGTLLGLASLPFGWVIPNLLTLGVLIAGGLVGGVGQLFLTESFRRAPVAVVAPFEYTQLVWAAAIGFVIWAEVPSGYTLLGAAVVAASGLYILYRETRRLRVRPDAGTPADR